jgi:hypothetical protein
MQDFQVMIGANRPPLRLRQSRHNTLSQRPYSLTSNDRREGTCTMQCGSRPNNYALLPRVTEKTQGGDEAHLRGATRSRWCGDAGTGLIKCTRGRVR